MRGAEDNAVADTVTRKQIMNGWPKRGMLAHKELRSGVQRNWNTEDNYAFDAGICRLIAARTLS